MIQKAFENVVKGDHVTVVEVKGNCLSSTRDRVSSVKAEHKDGVYGVMMYTNGGFKLFVPALELWRTKYTDNVDGKYRVFSLL